MRRVLCDAATVRLLIVAVFIICLSPMYLFGYLTGFDEWR